MSPERSVAIAVLVVALASVQVSRAGPRAPAAVVDTTLGPVRGARIATETGQAAEAYLGIPYAETTAGPNRWRPPVPRAPWSATRDATGFGPIPPQEHPPPGVVSSEDCLSLNVWRPAGTKPGDGLPVMVWIYGGSFVSGASSYGLYDGAYLAANKGVVVVSLNYRVGALGFLKLEGMAGNFGLLDQQLALRWVQSNMERFGGDPAKVTLFGESAGAYSIGAHLFSVPSSDELFRAAILESNPAAAPPKTERDARLQGALFLRSAGCQDVACLRAKSVEEILEAQQAYVDKFPVVFAGQELPFAPYVDGTLVHQAPVAGYVAGCTPKPVLVGTLANEASLFYAGHPLTYTEYQHLARQGFGEDAPAVLRRYPGKPGGDNAARAAGKITDYLFRCSSHHLAGLSEAPTYVYLMTHSPSFPVFGGERCANLVCHGDDLPFVFHSAAALGHRFTAAEEELSQAVMDAFTRFAKTLSPNPGGAPDAPWPRYRSEKPRYYRFDLSSRTEPYTWTETCAFWDGIGYDRHPRKYLVSDHRRGAEDEAISRMSHPRKDGHAGPARDPGP